MELKEFEISVLPLRDKLYRFARQLTQNDGESQDIVQEVFIRLWNRRNTLKQYKSVEALAMVITKNLSLDFLKARRSHTTTLESVSLSVDHRTPEHYTEIRDTVQALKKMLSELPEQQRMIFHLREVEEMEFDEIGEIAGMTANAVRVNLSRARNTVREQLIKKENYVSGD